MAESLPSGSDRRPPYLAIVRQGHDEVFEFLRHFQEENLTEVLWDRRVAERRGEEGSTQPERRHSERRSLPSPTWDALGFVLAPLSKEHADLTLIPDAPPETSLESTEPTAPGPAPRRYDLCVVHRGHPEVFQLMQEHFRDDSSVQVIWDRRVRERRQSPVPAEPDRRRGERRRP
jgi:hypothetical protein